VTIGAVTGGATGSGFGAAGAGDGAMTGGVAAEGAGVPALELTLASGAGDCARE
jgi:hypothetical protein